jgi:hypothetical protein
VVRAASGVWARALSAGSGGRSAEGLGGGVLVLAATEGADELPDVVDTVEATTVHELVDLAEARGCAGAAWAVLEKPTMAKAATAPATRMRFMMRPFSWWGASLHPLTVIP